MAKSENGCDYSDSSSSPSAGEPDYCFVLLVPNCPGCAIIRANSPTVVKEVALGWFNHKVRDFGMAQVHNAVLHPAVGTDPDRYSDSESDSGDLGRARVSPSGFSTPKTTLTTPRCQTKKKQ